MNFYCIQSGQKEVTDSLESACKKRGVAFHTLDPRTFDYSTPLKLSSDDILYRALTGEDGRTLEKFLLTPDVITFYKNYQRSMALYNYSAFFYEQKGVSQPKTIPLLTTDKSLLSRYAQAVGGFPLIIKVLGGSHGVGVIKVDSPSSLFSIADFLVKSGLNGVLRQYIPARSHARLIVLGKEVIGSIEYLVQGEDFRSNVGSSPVVRPKKFSPATEALAVKAVNLIDVEFGGVDIISDQNTGADYVLEVNFPCFFPRVEAATGESMSEKMVDYLVKKAS